MIWHVSGALALAVALSFNHSQELKIDPGQWETTITMEIPGLGGQTSTTNRYCISPEEATAGPRQIFEPEDSSCEFLSYDYSDGTIAMEMLCKTDAGDMKVTTMGSFTERSYQMTSVTEATFNGTPMSMTSKINGRYLGPCDTDQ